MRLLSLLIAVIFLSACEENIVDGKSNEALKIEILDQCQAELGDLNKNIKDLIESISELNEKISRKR